MINNYGCTPMKRKLQFVTLLFEGLKENVTLYMANGGDGFNANYLDKNHSKTALKRKIIMLRQELLNLERMIEE